MKVYIYASSTSDRRGVLDAMLDTKCLKSDECLAITRPFAKFDTRFFRNADLFVAVRSDMAGDPPDLDYYIAAAQNHRVPILDGTAATIINLIFKLTY